MRVEPSQRPRGGARVGRNRCSRRTAAAVDVDKGNAVVHADDEILRAIAAAEDDRVRLQRGRLDPGRQVSDEAEGQASGPAAGIVMGALPLRRRPGPMSESVVAIGVANHCHGPTNRARGAALGKVIDQFRVGVVGLFGSPRPGR